MDLISLTPSFQGQPIVPLLQIGKKHQVLMLKKTFLTFLNTDLEKVKKLVQDVEGIDNSEIQ